MATGQHVQTWRTARDYRRWLSLLIDAMEEAARPELRGLPCDAKVVAELWPHLVGPATYAYSGSAFSFRN